MQKETQIFETSADMLETIAIVGDAARYDAQALAILKNKVLLAHILKAYVSEVKNNSIEEIVSFMDEDILVRMVGVDPNKKIIPNVAEQKTESKIVGEGTIRFDLRFNLHIPEQDKPIKIIVDVEAQGKVETLKYNLVTRVIYYLCRLVSEQQGSEFVNSNYDDIKKVYSIWICMPAKRNSSVQTYSIKENLEYGTYGNDGRYDIIEGVVIRLGDDYKSESDELLKTLTTIFSSSISKEEKVQELSSKLPSEVVKGASGMTSLGHEIFLEGKAEGKTEGITEGIIEGVKVKANEVAKTLLAKGFSGDEISEIAKLSLDEIQKLREELSKQG